MDELLGFDVDVEGFASTLDQADESQQPEFAQHLQPTSKTTGEIGENDDLQRADNVTANVVASEEPLGVRVRATKMAGLGVFATRDFARGDVIFTERPQLVAAASTSSRHCAACLRALADCPAELPHAHLWPVAPRQTACAGCGAQYCCATCLAADEKRGHRRLCAAIAAGDLDAFESCCREQCAGLSADSKLSAVSARLALQMMAHHAELLQPSGCENKKARPYAHLTEGLSSTAASAPRAASSSFASRLYPLVRAALRLSASESTTDGLDEPSLRALLNMVSSNATWVEPVSSFADYLAASRTVRRREEDGRTLKQLEAHCAALRREHAEALNGSERVDEVADWVYGARGGALYLLQSKMNHACVHPNCMLVCSFTDATIDVVAKEEVPCGAELTISYCAPGLDRARRRQQLRTSYGFDCCCPACVAGL